MNEPNMNDFSASLSRLADALERIDAQQSTLNTRVDRIVATIEENSVSSDTDQKIVALEARRLCSRCIAGPAQDPLAAHDFPAGQERHRARRQPHGRCRTGKIP